VREAIASALAQTQRAEVIVCDDGSTDATAAELASYGDDIRVVAKENGGGASALNAATSVATGDFVAILDADDVYDPRRVEAMGKLAAARPDLDIVTTDAFYEVAGRIVGRFNEATPFVVGSQRAGILRACFVGGWPAVRRTRLVAAGGWDESLRIGYDWDCWLRLILDGSQAGLVDEPLMTYRVHAGSLTANRVDSLRARVALLERAQEHPSLTRTERRILRASIQWQRSRLRRTVCEESAPSSGRGRAKLLLARCRESLARLRFAAVAPPHSNG
jgi:glycosyltransferase involved in cell wall biosynthesis